MNNSDNRVDADPSEAQAAVRDRRCCLAAASASALLAIDFGSNEKTTQSVAHESAYVQATSSLAPARLAPGFGAGTSSTGPVCTSGLSPNERRHVETIASHTREEQATAFGNGR